YENFGWSARVAWNWRDEYLMAANQNGNNRNPYFVEAYDQIDLTVSYQLTDQLTIAAEAINLTGEDVRWSARRTTSSCAWSTSRRVTCWVCVTRSDRNRDVASSIGKAGTVASATVPFFRRF